MTTFREQKEDERSLTEEDLKDRRIGNMDDKRRDGRYNHNEREKRVLWLIWSN